MTTTNKRPRPKLLAEVRKQVEHATAAPLPELKAAQEPLAYLSWLASHCSRFAALPVFLDEVQSDIVAILYACALGMERTAYLHARSLLENLIRHCYFDSRPALFVTRQVEPEEAIRDRWAEQFEEIQRLPHFRSASKKDDEGDDTSLFAEISAVYVQSSRFVHGSTARYRNMYKNIRSVGLDPPRAQELTDFLRRLCESSLLLLALYHLGPYMLISQPIRRYMLMAMRRDGRARLLRCLGEVPLTWAEHQRSAALQHLRESNRNPRMSPAGLARDKTGRVRIAHPGG